jgi:hypothetical protein
VGANFGTLIFNVPESGKKRGEKGNMSKYYKHFYVTQELKDRLIKIADEERLNNTQIVYRAVDIFKHNGEYIPEAVCIKKRSHPDYIKRNTMLHVWIDDYNIDYISSVAEDNGCSFSAALYQILNEYVQLYDRWRYGVE